MFKSSVWKYLLSVVVYVVTILAVDDNHKFEENSLISFGIFTFSYWIGVWYWNKRRTKEKEQKIAVKFKTFCSIKPANSLSIFSDKNLKYFMLY
ncbi:hypothetical protein [Peribacillus sp. Hz7]|uniref:hypothetical protein n=1 Tax=Peribacillus sp. Hz7 TaxID=3344873 RepID=UPI0035CB77DB